jgi:hypothetical protein
MYFIKIFQVVYLLQFDENGEKIWDENEKPKRTRTVKPMASEKLNERLEVSSDMLSRRIEMQLTRDLWEKHEKLFLVSNIMKHHGAFLIIPHVKKTCA